MGHIIAVRRGQTSRAKPAQVKPSRRKEYAPEQIEAFGVILEAAHTMSPNGESVSERRFMSLYPHLSRTTFRAAKIYWTKRASWGFAESVSGVPVGYVFTTQAIEEKEVEEIGFKTGDYADIRPDDGGAIVCVETFGMRYEPRFKRFRAAPAKKKRGAA
jgi:hypothetical protein